jgi:hypothetical protein
VEGEFDISKKVILPPEEGGDKANKIPLKFSPSKGIIGAQKLLTVRIEFYILFCLSTSSKYWVQVNS